MHDNVKFSGALGVCTKALEKVQIQPYIYEEIV